MSEVTPTEVSNQEPESTPQDQLKLLKARADLLGVKYHPNIGIDNLKERIAAKMSGEVKPEPKEPVKLTNIPGTKVKETTLTKTNRLRRESAKLIRIRVSCMNPNKREWEGEIFTVSNSVVGTHKKYVPFNAEEGWHVPKLICTAIQERKCTVFKTVKNGRGDKVRKPYSIKEFSVEILDPLTIGEIQDLAQRQAMANGTAEV